MSFFLCVLSVEPYKEPGLGIMNLPIDKMSLKFRRNMLGSNEQRDLSHADR